MVSSSVRAAARLCLWLLTVCLPATAGAQAAPDGATTLVRRLEQAAGAADRRGILDLADAAISRPSFEDFTSTLVSPAPSRVVIFERDRTPLPERGQRLMIEVFTERGIEAQVGTWRLDVGPGPSDAQPWVITAVSRLSIASGLYRLSLNTSKQYDIHDLTVVAPDLTIEMSSGRAFVAETPDGPTAVVLLGRGRIRFTPSDPAEQTQIRIFAGDAALVADIDMAFIRLPPGDFEARFAAASLKPRAVLVPADVRAASGVFNDYIGRSLQINLAEFSRDRWSLTPSSGDIVVEMRTRKFGTLTYARSGSDAEDVSLFDRRRRRNISVYASAAKLAERGRFYDEDDLTDYDVLAYDIDAEFSPERGAIDCNARLKIKIRNDGVSSLTLRLAESLVVRGVYSPEYGRLLHLRAVGQNTVIVNLPARLSAATELWIGVIYGGTLAAQTFEREAIQIRGEAPEPVFIPLERRFLYSNRSYWYPQSLVTDYATASLRVSVPNDYDVVATGDPIAPPAPPAGAPDSAQRRRKIYAFNAAKPTRYIALLISRFDPVDSTRVNAGGVDVALYLQSARRGGRVRTMAEKTADIFQFYGSLVGDAPYPSFTLALVDSDRPGGHSPPYFAMLNQVLPMSEFVWRNDPVSFDNFPTFFLAHEVAHQWWGHAVGWKNYHEQWLSEGFAQYFAALYAEKELEASVLPNLLRQMRRTAIAASPDGPVYLGYRLGHIQGDDRVFRAVIYNKAAMVLHMLRRLLGDDAFFSGVRSFYSEWKFRKAGTDDFRRAMEKVSGRDLNRFFETWIYGITIPRLKFSYSTHGAEAILRFEQSEVADVPVTVTVEYASGATEDVTIPLADRLTERTIALRGPVRSMVANGDNAALVEIEK